MKYVFILYFTVLSLYANYAYQGENAGKIDMHGGKKQKLVNDKQPISNKPFMLGNMGDSNNTDKKEDKENKQKNKN